MHTKTKGSIGEIAVVKDLYLHGYPVFTEFGDNCKVDLIVLIDYKPIKIQVKASTSKNGTVTLFRRSSGPGYSYQYTSDEVDVVAGYILDKDIVFYVPMTELCNKTTMTFRFSPAKNGQTHNINELNNYLDIRNTLL